MDTFVGNIIKPLLRRLGSMGAGALATWGATAEQTAQIEVAIVAISMIGVDLFLSNWMKQK
jgi:hypothetical protein